MQVHIQSHKQQQNTQLIQTIQDSNWRSEGVTYRRGIAPIFSKNNGLNKEIENPSTKEQELGFEQWGRCFLSERERVGGDSPGGALHRAGAAPGRGQVLTCVWDLPLLLGGPPGQPQPLLWLFGKIKIYAIFSGIFLTTFT